MRISYTHSRYKIQLCFKLSLELVSWRDRDRWRWRWFYFQIVCCAQLCNAVAHLQYCAWVANFIYGGHYKILILTCCTRQQKPITTLYWLVVNAGYSSLVEWLYELHYNVYEDLHLTNWELWWGRWITGLHLFTRQQVSHKSSMFPSCHSVQATTTTLWWSSQIKSMAGNAPKSMDMDCDRNKFPPKLLLCGDQNMTLRYLNEK